MWRLSLIADAAFFASTVAENYTPVTVWVVDLEVEKQRRPGEYPGVLESILE